MVEVTPHPDPDETSEDIRVLEREYRAVVEEILELRGADDRIRAFLRSIDDAGTLADTVGYSPDVSTQEKVRVLETIDVTERLRLAVEIQRDRLAELQIRKRIHDDVTEGAENQQREYFLRKQMDSIRKELGEDDASVVEEYRTKIEESGMPDEAREQAERELGRLERAGEGSGESSMIRTYLDWMVSVPWSEASDEVLDPVGAREVLDADHAGLEDVKERITEYIAVRKLREERGIEDEGRGAGAILTLIGPPGTGKTSIGESIARATGREFVRMSLGGVRDEAEIRGHRRTYIGAMPGRLVRALRDAKTMNPVILLDEVDKVGADWRGDPSSALLEVLDPAQNHSFRDHYLDVELDLSQVLFIATANMADGDPRPATRPHGGRELRRLHDRREGRDRPRLPVAQAAEEERSPRRGGRDHRRAPARDGHRVHPRGGRARPRARDRQAPPKDRDPHCVGQATRDTITIEREAIRDALGRQRFFQESAERTAVPGVATGLSVTGAGGDVLFIETTSMPGKDDFVLTGQLGDVMKESARIALSYVRGHAEELGPRPGQLRQARVPHPRSRGSDPEGRAQRGHHDDDRSGVAPDRPSGQAHRRDDRRGHPPGPGPPHRRAQAEGPGGPRGRPDRRDHPGAEPRRPGRRARRGARGDDLPPGHDDRRGPRTRARAGAGYRGGIDPAKGYLEISSIE